MSTSRSNGPGAERRRHGGLHVCFRNVQRADLVPVGRIGLEVGLRRFLPLGLQGLRATPIAHQHGVGLIDALQNLARHIAAAPVLRQTEVHPAAFGRALHQPGLRQQLQMPADARLALPQDAREVFDVELPLRQQHQHAQPCRLRHGLQHADGRRKTELRTRIHVADHGVMI